MILICDDDAAVRSSLSLVLKRAGYEVATVTNPSEAIDFVRNNHPDLILMDMNYSHGVSGDEGLTLLKQVKIFVPDVPVILITAWGSISLAVKGMKAGAFDFVTKPWNNISLLNTIQTAIQLNDKTSENSSKSDDFNYNNIIGKSPSLMRIFDIIKNISKTNASVLITGESGTGKELIAEAIYLNSNRVNKPYVKVNLGGISQSLFESEMFGHKKGAFTDAQYDRKGRFEIADSGTIFLDEIGDLDLSSQVKLLRVLQDHSFEVLGDSKAKQVDVRVISATNRDLPEMIAKGTFREDLFYRINLISLKIPPLRERAEDIPALVDYFVKKQISINNLSNIEISSEAINFLQKLPFPGNIRELKNLVERTILVSNKSEITDIDFKNQYIDLPTNKFNVEKPISSLDEVEKEMIIKAMELHGNNIAKVAAVLGLTRQSLYRRLEKYGING
ncbi:sigma-54 dependent transcriptional regulator [Bacteroidales bacterium OttesenSCG-928-K03]|nr:sigma-54 dependent transcriptional regulator [Odoribacter sp. OttesenSCG-928-L07]MDL2239760.1 sigma-54 dependent transcriptional regulator [Bacteroidales bacterium OttesenSCG-928-L14]MDL2242291.1 sigma-54 dependent transcriptional regulator [Bacteroidales bacterium OttesenSCG-928-K03]